MQTLSTETWDRLKSLSRRAEQDGWASQGVFATAVGPEFFSGSSQRIAYIGKAAGPLIDQVGVNQDFLNSQMATTSWMMGRKNPSAFWIFADLICTRREELAWTNLSKIDTRTPRPPSNREWQSISEACLTALKEELNYLEPLKTVFVTDGFQDHATDKILQQTGFERFFPNIQLERTTCYRCNNGRLAVITRHPQGWTREPRNAVAKFIRDW